MSTSSPQSFVVLLPGAEHRLLGGSSRERNARVAARGGATVVTPDAVPDSDEPALLVPPHLAIDVALFPLAAGRTVIELVPDSLARDTNISKGGAIAGSCRELRRLILAASGPINIPQELSPPNALMDLSTSRGRRLATWTILQRTVKPTDGWVSRHFNRPVSRVISFSMLTLGLRASHASALTLVAGIVAAVVAAQPGYAPLVATGLLFHLASVLDGVDGEMARSTLTESDAGARLDTIVDQLTYVACFAGITIGWAREGRGLEAVGWIVAVVVALLLSLWRGGRFVARYAPNASFVFIDRSVRRAASDTGLPLLRLAAHAFTLLRRDLFSVVFMGVALLGNRALIPAMVAAGIVVANLTMTVYHRELAAAARSERAGSG